MSFRYLPGVRIFILRDLFRRSDRDDLAAADAAFGAEIDHVVGGFDHIEIVLDHEQASAVVDQGAEGGEQLVDVVEMQAGRRLVEDKKRFRVRLLREMRRELYALGLAAAKASSPIVRAADSRARPRRAPSVLLISFFTSLKNRIASRTVISRTSCDVFALVFDVENLVAETRAAAIFAGQFDIGQKLHLDRDRSAALTGLAASAGHVERKMRRVEALSISRLASRQKLRGSRRRL